MPKNNNFDIKRLNENPGAVLAVILFIIALLSIIYLIFKPKNPADAPIQEGQVMIQKGDDIIIVNKNGLVEYRNKDKVYYETWDESEVSSFFSMIEQKARESLNKPQSESCEYKVYLFLDGKLVSFCTDDEEIAEVVEEITDKYSGGELSDFFDEDGYSDDDGNGEFDGTIVFPTLTPTIGISSPTPTPTTSPGEGGQTNYPPVEAGCDTWSEDIVGGRAVITNTYCTTEPTSTPTL